MHDIPITKADYTAYLSKLPHKAKVTFNGGVCWSSSAHWLSYNFILIKRKDYHDDMHTTWTTTYYKRVALTDPSNSV